jgi:hypothetical protein
MWKGQDLIMPIPILIFVILVILVFGPVFTISALNTLFNLGIELNPSTWFAAFWLLLVVGSSKVNSK